MKKSRFLVTDSFLCFRDSIKKNLLYINVNSKVELFPDSETRYYLLGFGAPITFVKDDKGEVTGLIVPFGGEDHPGNKIK